MNKTKIDWATMTWNPVTGCYHNCPECYARRIAERFSDKYDLAKLPGKPEKENNPLFILPNKTTHSSKNGENVYSPYPFGFFPTYHKYRLDEPLKSKKPENIFVCSMADLFGNWVPDEWISDVLEVCKAAPWHNYIFLTQNPSKYYDLFSKIIGFPPSNWYLGTTVKNQRMMDDWEKSSKDWIPCGCKFFLSMEPLQEPISIPGKIIDWIIIGAETGNRKEKAIPQKSWIESIVSHCQRNGIPLFMKDNLRKCYDGELIREYPAGLAAVLEGKEKESKVGMG